MTDQILHLSDEKVFVCREVLANARYQPNKLGCALNPSSDVTTWRCDHADALGEASLFRARAACGFNDQPNTTNTQQSMNGKVLV